MDAGGRAFPKHSSPVGAEPSLRKRRCNYMPNAQNKAQVEAIKNDLEDVTSVWVVDYRGLSVKDAQQLRRNIREAGASMKVYKNNLMRIALEDAGLPTMDDLLKGPSAFVFADDDPAAAAKAVKNFAKDNENLVIKGGLMEGEQVGVAEIEAIASLPSREELMAQIAAAINGVARGLATTINGVPSGLAQAIKQVAEQKPAA